MPISRSYTGGSIVYFQGDVGEEVYVLSQGRVVLISTALDTGEELKEEVRQGEFFGVKSSLGRYAREETAQVLGKTSLLVFKLPEFEQFVMKNTRLIMKMLRVFSKQLRNIHRQIRDILKAGVARDPAFELMNVAESFYKSGNIDYAVYAFTKYMEHYPGGMFVPRAQEMLQMARKGLTYPMGYPTLESVAGDMSHDESSSVSHGFSPADRAIDDPFALNLGEAKPDRAEATIIDVFNEGLSQFARENYPAALQNFDKTMTFTRLKNQEESDIFARAHYEKGRTEIKLGKFDDAANSFSNYIKKFPTGDFVKESIFQMGLAAEAKGNKERAKTLYHKVATMPPPDDVTREARKRLEKLG